MTPVESNPSLAKLSRLTDELAGHAPAFSSLTEIARIQRALLYATAVQDETEAARMLALPQARALGKRLRELNARATDALELEYAKRVLAGESIASFPHYSNYEHLHSHLAEAAGARTSGHLLFVGSGPFPITALLAARLFQKVTCVDRDARANAIASRIVAKHCFGSRIGFITEDAERLREVPQDAVLVASLVGATVEEKERVFLALRERMKPGALLMGRDAHGLRSLVYQPIPETVWAGMDTVSSQFAGAECMNSLVAARIPESRG